MESFLASGKTHTLGPRIPMNPEPLKAVRSPSSAWGMNIPSRIVPRAEETCTSENANMCEKPVGSGTPTIAIVLGIVIPVVVISAVLLYLHRRNVAKFKKEDQNDPNKELDFGLGDKNPGVKQSLRRSIFGVGEKNPNHKHQLSMDMDMSTPYLLPPQLQSSRESLHSLARSIQNSEDPYRPVTNYAGSEVGSLRSVHRGPGGELSSLYSASTRSGGTKDFGPQRQNSLPRPPPPAAADPFQRKPMPSSDGSMSPTSISSPDAFKPAQGSALARSPSIPYPDEKTPAEEPGAAIMPDLENAAVVSPTPPKIDLALPVQGSRSPPAGSFVTPMSATIETVEASPANPHESFPSSDNNQPRDANYAETYIGTAHSSPPQQQEAPYDSLPQVQEAPAYDENQSYGTYETQNYGQDGYMDFDYEPRGRAANRDTQRGSQFLAAPNMENKRLSVGFRPLPPDEIMETEDPEHRANRIRSFYKEYFDDQNPGAHPPVPDLPPQAGERQAGPAGQPPQRGQPNEYYEDYDGAYLENTFFDPGSNSFVMPYAQPVHRRAMTPPPRAPRHRGPPPPRAVHGSIGGMSMPGGRPPFRPGSSASSRYGPRPGSSASARLGNKGKPLPPPSVLTTLPNPAKLRDDSFAIFNATDFAPRDSFKDQAAGRSQSPAPERRPYALNVPIHTPLASSYDDLAAIPSPHMLRKSSTFTGLDFAPPRRFKDNGDVMSDAGSIRSYRSNRSGISAVNNAALRGGAGRVSRLPGDTVFTQAQMADQLKPSWTMRP
ncbi:hypothetical protein jhhlp_002181 [Lomentospora prolificans]|uniref:Uncharacterized protein n=1 Tax=Lomentospora prolificans TaxID=41688 RepID=A0A2N3NDA3_9PEZI|nr:hypothetical protein jhhlp_002181 [Lomentospora prolificans]